MAKIFITGSSDGIGLETAKLLIKSGHEVIFHARNEQRALELQNILEEKHQILIADLSNSDEVKKLAKEVNQLATFDVVIHNAGVYQSTSQEIFKVNVLAPYILTQLINKPKRLIYIGSNMHPQGDAMVESLSIEKGVDYSSSKLLILMLSLAFSKIYEDIAINTIDPGWVKTKMANYNAPDSLLDGSETQVWLATTDEKFTGKYFYHKKEASYSKKADDINTQKKLLLKLQEITNIKDYNNQ